MENVPKTIQEKYEQIIKSHGQMKVMNALREKEDELIRVESPMTNNIYDMGTPSIARTIELLEVVDQDDPTEMYILAIAFFVHSIYVYDRDDDSYIPITAEDESGKPNETYTSDLIGALKMLPQSELTMLHDMTDDMMYTPSFIMNSKCPHCGTDLTNSIPVNDLVFFVTPETPVEMKR